MRVVLVLALIACGPRPAPKPVAKPPPASPISDRMETFEMNGYLLAGAEYWPYIGKEDIKYPQEVLWGFYPEKGVIPPGETDPNPDSASHEAVDCAQQSFAALQVFLAKNPPALRRIVELGEPQGFVPRFYLWTNDYTRASDPYPPGVREARLWYWKRKQPEPPKPPGYWKWEATVTQDGHCKIPAAEQIDTYLAETLKSLER
jgi:hypothetical protein